MNFRSSLFFAYRLFFPRSERSSIASKSILGAVLCIGISIVPLVVVSAVSEGMIQGMVNRLVSVGTGGIRAYVSRRSNVVSSVESFTSVCSLFSEIKEVEEVFPTVECDALASGKNFRSGSKIRGVELDIFSRNSDFKELFEISSGSIKDFENQKINGTKAVIGEKLSELLNVKAGDTFRLITTKTNASGSVIPVTKVFSVAAVVSSGFQELDALWVFLPLGTALSFVPNSMSQYSLMFKISSPYSDSIQDVKAQINERCQSFGYAYTWKELNQDKLALYESTEVLLEFIMFLIVLVAVVNISSALVMVVMERRKEIAILKSMGASNEGIFWSFVLLGLFCGISGILIGLPIGLLCAENATFLVHLAEHIVNLFAKILFLLKGGTLSSFQNITLLNPEYYITKISVNVSFVEMYGICIMVLLLSVFVSVFPALKAGNENLLDLLRGSSKKSAKKIIFWSDYGKNL